MNQILSRLGKAMGLLMTIMGGFVSGILLLIIILAQLTGGWLVVTLPFLIIFGLIPLGLGVASLYASNKIAQQAIRDRFYQLLRKDTGRISLLSFSSATRLEPAIAREYLDAWARECDATFDVTDEGDIYYIFSTEPRSLPAGATPAFTPWKNLAKVLERS
jgi:hypothetical protein